MLDTTTAATFVSGVGAGSETSAVAAIGENGVGALVGSYDGSAWTKTKVNGAMLLDGAVTKDKHYVITGVYNTLVSADGESFSTAAGAKGSSQSANVYGENRDKIALVGAWSAGPGVWVNGVATSADNGETFTISSAVPDGSVRYGAFPTENTWFIASGMWGEDPPKSKREHALSARVSRDLRTNEHVYHFLDESAQKVKRPAASSNSTGWFGSVSKTTDGGRTWTKVLGTNLAEDYLYFNAISCSSETNCVVVAEGDDAVNGGYLAVAYATFDGGASWEQTFRTNQLVSLMGVKFVNKNEAWMLGTSKSGRQLYGQFYKTTDGGKTFNLVQSLQNCLAIDLDVIGEAGYAACCNSSGSACNVAVYK